MKCTIAFYRTVNPSEAKAAGAIVLHGPESREGEPIFLAGLRDPEGNEISLYQYKG